MFKGFSFGSTTSTPAFGAATTTATSAPAGFGGMFYLVPAVYYSFQRGT